MDNTNLGSRIKQLRNQRALSQEALAEESGLSLRTIQRIENGSSNPTGDTLKRLAQALNVSPDELIDWAIKEDYGFLTFFNLSALMFVFFPLLGILLPFMLWTHKKGKIKDLDQVARSLINFQINWNIVLFAVPLLLVALSALGILPELSLRTLILVIVTFYGINLISIVLNSVLLYKKKKVRYLSGVRFFR